MNIYRVCLTKGNGADVRKSVLAKDVSEAIVNMHRFAEENYYYSYDIYEVSKEGVVDVYYKNPKKVKKSKSKK